MDQQEPKKEPTKDDLGTRYDHLVEYREALEECIEILKRRMQTLPTQQRIVKLMIATEVVTSTIDAYSGYSKDNTEYTLYKLLNTVPANKDALIALGGTPLESS